MKHKVNGIKSMFGATIMLSSLILPVVTNPAFDSSAGIRSTLNKSEQGKRKKRNKTAKASRKRNR